MATNITANLGALLKQKHLKITPQRLAIFNMLINTIEHPNAETIYNALMPQHPGLSLATVYKTLDSLCTAGLLQALNVGEGRSRYDANCADHPHFICQQCTHVFDVPHISGAEFLRAQAAQTMNAEITHTQLFFYGLCTNCRADQ